MTVYIRQTLLYRAKYRNLRICGKAFEVFWYFEGGSDVAALSKTLDIPMQSGRKSDFIE
jgi:hypothetical protein